MEFLKENDEVKFFIPDYSSSTLPSMEFLQGIIFTLRSDKIHNLIERTQSQKRWYKLWGSDAY